ncbi:MAG TPA: hypothetical protein VFA30_09285 [Gaiellaceae bacterium]|nr:hypothetical protein [Gaiellaceae bacterium]
MTLWLALPLLGVSRLLPDHGFGLWLRLAAATLVLLAPGRLVARALGLRGAAAALAWSVGIVAAALALMFAVHGSLDLVVVLLAIVAVGALPFQRRGRRRTVTDWRLPGRRPVALAGVALGIAIWSIEGIVADDTLFHLGRMRKLLDFGSLALRSVDEFKDGGLHPGYAFPLWQGWLSLVAKLAGVDPTAVVLHEPSMLVPFALLLAYELGWVLFRSAPLALAALLAQVAMIALAPGDGGAYTSLELPGTTARQLLVPATLALFFRFVRAPAWTIFATLVAASLDLAFVHPTYALFLAIPLVAYVAVRALTVGELRDGVRALVAFGAPFVGVSLWLAPIVAETHSVRPSRAAKAAGLLLYKGDLVEHSSSSYHLAAGLVSRTGTVALAALLVTPLAALAARRRWSAFVLGGMVAVLGIELAPFLFPHFSDAVSLSQSRRAAGFVPFAIAFAGGAAVLARALRAAVLPVALAAGIVLQHEYPGDFSLRVQHLSPSAPAWVALFGGLAGIAAAIALARRGLGRFEDRGVLAGLAAVLFVLPVAVHGFSHWSAETTSDPYALTPGLVRYLRTDVPKRAVVFADLETSYRISAYVPVYVANGPPAHVADTKANNPKRRRRDLLRFLRTHDLAIPRGYGAGWLVLRGRERIGSGARLVYRDRIFRVYRL